MTRDDPSEIHLDFELSRFFRRVRARSMSRLGEIHPGLDYGTFLVFIAICDSDDSIRASSVAGDLGIHKSTTSRAVSLLEKLGMVTRAPDPEDGRAQLLVAEDEYRHRLEAYRRRSQVWLREVLAGWEPEEVEAFARNFGRLNDAAEQIP